MSGIMTLLAQPLRPRFCSLRALRQHSSFDHDSAEVVGLAEGRMGCSPVGYGLLMKQFHDAPDKRALSVTVLRAVCSTDVEQRRAQISKKKQTAIGRAAFKSLARDLPYGLIVYAAAILTVFGILIAFLDSWAP
jgi:hypothetical protein